MVDIFTIAIGFVLRVYAGAMALGVPVSSWMAICRCALALCLAAVRRRQELSQSGTEGRKVLEKYSVALVGIHAEDVRHGALLFPASFRHVDGALVITVPLVLFGLFRYWFDQVEALEGGESPTDALLADWQFAAHGGAVGGRLWLGVVASRSVTLDACYAEPCSAWLVAGSRNSSSTASRPGNGRSG